VEKRFFGLLGSVENPKKLRHVAGREDVLFLKKKNQKNFCPFAGFNA
jgi:hypothetical protein